MLVAALRPVDNLTEAGANVPNAPLASSDARWTAFELGPDCSWPPMTNSELPAATTLAKPTGVDKVTFAIVVNAASEPSDWIAAPSTVLAVPPGVPPPIM